MPGAELRRCPVGPARRAPLADTWETCREDCALRVKSHDSRPLPETRCSACSEGCHREYWKVEYARCGFGGDRFEVGRTLEEGEPFCGEWKEVAPKE